MFKHYSSETVTLLKCVYYSIKAFGFLTPSLNIKYSKGNKNAVEHIFFTSNKLSIVYNLILICSIISLNWMSAYNNPRAGSIHLDELMNKVHMMITLVTSIYIITLNCIQQKKAVALANRINVIRESYCKSNIVLKRDILKILVLNFCTNVALLVLTPHDGFHMFTHRIARIFPAFVMNSVLVQYTVVMKLMRRLFQVVNERLIGMMKSDRIWICKVGHGNPYHHKVDRLLNLRYLYSALSDASVEIAAFYSPAMLVCLVNVFLTLTLFGYYVTKPIVLDCKRWPVIMYLCIVFYMIVYIASLIILTKSVTDTVLESKKTGEIINDNMTDFENTNIDKKLKQFSNFLLQKDIQFKVFDLFSLDQSLLMSFTGSITTYLVILLQFQRNDDSQSKE